MRFLDERSRSVKFSKMSFISAHISESLTRECDSVAGRSLDRGVMTYHFTSIHSSFYGRHITYAIFPIPPLNPRRDRPRAGIVSPTGAGENRVKRSETRFPHFDDKGKVFHPKVPFPRKKTSRNRAATTGLSSQYRLGAGTRVFSVSSVAKWSRDTFLPPPPLNGGRRFRSISGLSHNRAIFCWRKFSELAAVR